MNWEPIVWVAVIGGIVTALGYLVKYFGDNSATRSTAKSEREKRLDARFDRYTDEIKEDRELLKRDVKELTVTVKEQGEKIETLENHRTVSDRREVLLYRHTKALRDHILNGFPPPPPAPPAELVDWFENFVMPQNPAGLA